MLQIEAFALVKLRITVKVEHVDDMLTSDLQWLIYHQTNNNHVTRIAHINCKTFTCLRGIKVVICSREMMCLCWLKSSHSRSFGLYSFYCKDWCNCFGKCLRSCSGIWSLISMCDWHGPSLLCVNYLVRCTLPHICWPRYISICNQLNVHLFAILTCNFSQVGNN